MDLYIARCTALPPGNDAPHAATLVGVAADTDALNSVARTSLAATGHKLLTLEDVGLVQDHLRRHGETELVAALIGAVTDAAPVQVSGFYPTGQTTRNADTVLLVEHHTLTPLDPKDTRPFWDRPWCPPELAKLLFDGAKRTYMVVDAAKRSELRRGFDIDALEMICDTVCLYSGALADDMREVAPYLIDLTPFGEADARIPAPLRDLFTTQWNGGANLFLRADCDHETLRKHLRHFLRIRSSEQAENWTFFRFWDPAVARVYFPGIATRAERVDRIFRITRDLPLEVISGTGPHALRFVPRDLQGPSQGARPIVFDAEDHALMQQVADAAFRDETALWLRDAYPDRFGSFDALHMDAAVAHIMAEGARVGCQLKDDYAYLAHMMLTLGGWFHVAGHPAAIADILHDGKRDLRARLSRAFIPAWQESPQAMLMGDWDAVRNHITALPSDAQITPQEFGNLTARFFKAHAAAVGEALAATKNDLKGLDLPLPAQGRLLVLTLIYGHRFYADPLRAWSTEPIADAVDTAWQDTFG